MRPPETPRLLFSQVKPDAAADQYRRADLGVWHAGDGIAVSGQAFRGGVNFHSVPERARKDYFQSKRRGRRKLIQVIVILQAGVAALERKYGPARRVWVFDRGIVSEPNLVSLRKRSGQYLVGTPRSKLKAVERELLEGRRVKAHILVAFLGYALRLTLKHLLRRNGSDLSPAQALAPLSTLQSADIVLPATDGREIRLRRVATPTPDQQRLLTQLGITLPERFNLNFECSADSAIA